MKGDSWKKKIVMHVYDVGAFD